MMRGSMCSEKKYEITSETECKHAAELLKLNWANAWDGTNEFPACFLSGYAIVADNETAAVFFNLSPTPKRTDVDEMFSAICRTEGARNQYLEGVI